MKHNRRKRCRHLVRLGQNSLDLRWVTNKSYLFTYFNSAVSNVYIPDNIGHNPNKSKTFIQSRPWKRAYEHQNYHYTSLIIRFYIPGLKGTTSTESDDFRAGEPEQVLV